MLKILEYLKTPVIKIACAEIHYRFLLINQLRDMSAFLPILRNKNT